ncbi:hypothetical protein H4R23_005890, partial [Coemansia sp. Cherry 401B]
MTSRSDNKDTAAPRPIPPTEQRRNSFAGWSQSLFSLPSRAPGATAPAAGASPPANYSLHPARTLSNADSASLPDSGPSAFTSMGLFRRFSASQVPQAPQQSVPAATAKGLSRAVGPAAMQKGAAHPLPRALEEVREDDPPS